MNTKKILSLIVAIAMIVTVVPAFGLTASAASSTTVIDTLGATVLWNAPDGSFNDTAVSSAWSGWTSTITSGYANVRSYNEGPTLQFYTGGSADVVATITSPGYGNGAEKLIIEWKQRSQTPSDLYIDFSFRDIDGTEIAFLKLDKNYTEADTTNGTDYYAMGYPSNGTDMAIVAYNNADGSTHTAEYYVGGEKVAEQTDLQGTINGFGSMVSSNGYWSTAWNHIGFADLTIGAVMPETAVSVTATYTVDGETVATETKTYDSEAASSVDFPAKYVYYNGEVYGAEATTLSNSANVPMSLVEHYASKSVGDTVAYDGREYTVTGGSVVVNGNFITGDTSAWTNRPGTAITGAAVAYDAEVDGNAMTISTSGSNDTNSIGTRWNVTAGKTYYLSFYVGGTQPSSDNYQYNRVFQSDGTTEIVAYGANMTNGAWKQIETVFTATGDTILFQGSWAENIKYANVELLPVEENTDASATVTVNYYYNEVSEANLYKTEQRSVLKGGTVSFDAVSTAKDGVFYSCDALTYENVDADASYDVVLTADNTKIATTSNFSYNFNTGDVIWAGDNGFNSADKTGTISIGWNNFRQTIMTFPIPEYDNAIVTGATLNVNVGHVNTSPARYDVYAIDPSYVDIGNGTMQNVSGITSIDNVVANGGIQVASTRVTTGDNQIPLDLSGVTSLGDTLALLIYSCDQVYTYSATTDTPPYLTDVTTTSALSYTVNYMTSDGTSLGSTTEQYVEGTQYGYDDEVIFPNVTIPAFDGYVFRTKTVSGDAASGYTVTLTYELATETRFFDNVASDTKLVSLNMLGAHDAFTANVSNKRDAAAIDRDEAGANVATMYPAATKAQSADAYAMLEAGVRYFDIRLSRSTDLSYNTNDVFYTTHNSLSDEFAPIASTIAQWAKEHPGEIIILDFQEVWDATSDGDTSENNRNGNTAATWQDLNTILTNAGINDYVTVGDESIKNLTYGGLTENGTKTNIILFGRENSRGVGNFNYRGKINAEDFAGRLYSNYTPSDGTKIDRYFSDNIGYIQSQVDAMDNNYLTDPDSDHPIWYMIRVMQAHGEPSEVASAFGASLIDDAASNNTALYNALAGNEHPEWLTSLPVIMVNDAVTNTSDLVTLLRNCNAAQNVTVKYVSGGTTVATKTKSLMIGTLYTGDVANGLISGSDGIYTVDAGTAPVTAPSNSAYIMPVPYSGNLSIDVTPFDSDVYTWRGGAVYVDNLTDDGAYKGNNNFAAFNWGSAGTHDRVGVAVLDAPSADAAEYYLEGTEVRFYGDLTALLYVVSYEDYQNVDLSDSAALTNILTSDKLAATVTSSSGGATKLALDADVVKAAIGSSGKIVVLGTAYGGLYGLAGDTMAVTSVAAVPTLTPALGWNANTSQFTIDFLFGDGIDGTYTVNVTGEGGFTASSEVTLSDSARGIAFSTVNTNRIYQAYASADGVNGETTSPVSIYSLVIDAIVNGGFGAIGADGTVKTIASAQLDAVNTVLNNGGIYLENNELTDEAKEIMTYDPNTHTITLKDEAFKAGLKFKNTNYADDAGAEGTVVSEDGKTINLSSIITTEALEAELFVLEDVELVLEPETVEESVVTETVETVLDFEEIL